MNVQECGTIPYPDSCTHEPCNSCLWALDSTIALEASSDGTMIGYLKPFNEYFMLPYLASNPLYASSSTSTRDLQAAQRILEVFWGTGSKAPIWGVTYPVNSSYDGYELLTDVASNQIPSFHVQFLHFSTKAFNTNPFFQKLFSN